MDSAHYLAVGVKNPNASGSCGKHAALTVYLKSVRHTAGGLRGFGSIIENPATRDKTIIAHVVRIPPYFGGIGVGNDQRFFVRRKCNSIGSGQGIDKQDHLTSGQFVDSLERNFLRDIFGKSVGWIGSIEILLAYGLNSYQKIRSDSLAFSLLNLTGGLFLMIYTLYKEAFANTFVNLVWVVIALIALARFLQQKSRRHSQT